jgi:predicted nuclease of restriction endonuclease-like RecB superfamily
MLTSDLIRPRLRMTNSSICVEQVGEHDQALQQLASDLMTLFRSHVGQPRSSWEKALDAFIGTRIDYVLIRGLAKVLTDAAVFTPRSTPLPPVTLREQAWAKGPAFRTTDLFRPHTRQQVMEQITSPLGLASEDLPTLLYADRQINYLLTDPGPAWTAEALLARYNLELARGVLYWASHMTIEASSNYKDLWHFMKLFKLMFIAERTPTGGYRIDLDGPISPFVTSTLRYGRQFAAFLPALLLCEQWRMRAQVRPPQSQGFLTYQLDHTGKLRTHFKGSGPFDSRLEADFADAFATKMGDKRGHWLLTRESDLLLLGDTVMIPDFVLTDERDEQRKVLVELVGFWHPDYLRRKVEKVRAAQCSHLLLLVSDYLNLTDQDFEGSPSEVIFFHEKPVLKDVMAAVEAIALRVYGPPPPRVRKQPAKKKEKKSRQTRSKKAEVSEQEIIERPDNSADLPSPDSDYSSDNAADAS